MQVLSICWIFFRVKFFFFNAIVHLVQCPRVIQDRGLLNVRIVDYEGKLER